MPALAQANSFAAADSPAAQPGQWISDTFDWWTRGNGLFYWSEQCVSNSGEFAYSVSIKRRPILTPYNEKTLYTESKQRCRTFGNLVSAPDGVYYYDTDQTRIARVASSQPYTPTTVLTTAEALNSSEALRYSEGFLYWPATTNKILRVGTDGTGFATVATSTPNPLSLVVLGATVVWTDNTGIWSIRTDCAALPCTSTKKPVASLPASATATGLLFHATGFTTYEYFWVENNVNIRRASCSAISNSCAGSTLFHAADAGWSIGELATDGTNLFWPEVFGEISQTDGRLLRQSLSGDTAQLFVEDQIGLDRQILVDGNTVYFATVGTNPGTVGGIYSQSTSSTSLNRDLRADAWEVTQAIQNTANEAPLVAHKATYVRLYPQQLSGPDAVNVEVELTGTHNGSPLPGSPLQPINGNRSLTAGGAYDRANLDDGWLFQLPDSWTAVGNLDLQAEVDPRDLYVDPDRSNNTIAQQLTFESQPPVCVVAIPVRTNNPLPSTKDPNFTQMVSRFERLWPVTDAWLYKQTEPIEELEVCWWGPFPYPCFGPYEMDDTSLISDSDKVITSLIARNFFSDDPDACDNVGAPTHYMGMVHPDADTTKDNGKTTTGYANYLINASWVKSPAHNPQPFPNQWNSMRQSGTMAQELAHNYYRLHVNCGDPSDLDNGYPYPGCQLDDTGPSNYYGFDVASLTPIPPDQAADFMSYGPNYWVSDYTWRSLMGKFALTTRAAAAVAPASTDAATIFASGFVDETNNRGKLNYLQVLPNAAMSAGMMRKLAHLQAVLADAIHAADVHEGHHGAVNYHLQLLDANGTVLSDQPITLNEQDNHHSDVTAVFMTSFDAPVGVVAKAALLVDSTVLDSLQPGPAAPVVSIQQPTGGAIIDANLVIQWTASDTDSNDRLLFTVQYSYDNGGHWQSLINDYPSTPNPVNTLNLADLGSIHGSNGNSALIRVIASDGYNTTIASSQPFQVPNRAPEPYIITPDAAQWFTPDQPIILEGGANDAEDGGVATSGLLWSVDDVDAGSGKVDHIAGVAPGSHVLTLKATDTASKTAVATTTLNISPLSIPQTTAPAMDGLCNDVAYKDAVQLQLKPYGNNAQASVHLLRSSSRLWACFTGLNQGAAAPGAFAGLRIDADDSRDPLAQATDYGYFVGEDGSVFTTASDGAGGFAANGPGGLQAQMSAESQTWSAELSIDAGVIGGWEHFVGLALGHYNVSAAADDYLWPYATEFNHPNSWAQTALGAHPTITALNPFTATVNSPAFTLAVEGSNFISPTTALWNGITLPTTVVDAHHLTVQVDAAQLTSAGAISLTVHTAAPFNSNAAVFTVLSLVPTISGLTPNHQSAEGSGFTLTVAGTNFAPDAVVLWNSSPLPTTFVDATTVTAQVDSALMAQGQTVDVAVRNGSPDGQTTPSLTFTVDPLSGNQFIYLPLMSR